MIHHSVFRASRDGGPRALPRNHSETAFRFRVRIPQNAPEAYAWAERKPGCVIEIRYRLLVVFKLRSAPRNPLNARDPQFWQGAFRLGEMPLSILFAENYVNVDSAHTPSPASYYLPACNSECTLQSESSSAALSLSPRKAHPASATSILKRKSITLELPAREHTIGIPLRLKVSARVPRMLAGRSNDITVKIDMLETVTFRYNRFSTSSTSVRSLSSLQNIDKNGRGNAVISFRTDFGDLYPSAHIATLRVEHFVKATLSPESRFALSVTVPIRMLPSTRRNLPSSNMPYLRRSFLDEILYPPSTQHAPWHRARVREVEKARERAAVAKKLMAALMPSELRSEHGDDVCVICLDDLKAEQAVVLRCMHVLHIQCLREWLHAKPECPVCKRVPLPITDRERSEKRMPRGAESSLQRSVT